MQVDIFSRTRLLIGDVAMNRLKASRVAVFGIGGVGGYAVEVLTRSGIGAIDLIDNDEVEPSNLNRQIIALHSTIGRPKVEVAAERVHDINPDCIVTIHQQFYMPENADMIDLALFDYVVDCIDTVTAKLELIRRCKHIGVPIISSMGAANKLDATAFRVADISKTKVDPLARVIRKRLRKEGITDLKVVYSEEEPLTPLTPVNEQVPDGRHTIPASCAFVPAAAGLIIGGEVIKDILSLS